MLGPVNLKIVLGVAVAILFIWGGLIGKPGALLAALIAPEALQGSS